MSPSCQMESGASLHSEWSYDLVRLPGKDWKGSLQETPKFSQTGFLVVSSTAGEATHQLFCLCMVDKVPGPASLLIRGPNQAGLHPTEFSGEIVHQLGSEDE